MVDKEVGEEVCRAIQNKENNIGRVRVTGIKENLFSS